MARHGLSGKAPAIGGMVLFVGLLFEAGCVLIGLLMVLLTKLLTGKWDARQ